MNRGETQGQRSVPAAEAIDDFGDLYPRPVGLNRFVVLSLARDSFSAYTCDIKALECECRDKQFNRDEGEICKHLAGAIWYADERGDFNDQVVRSLSDDIQGIYQELDALTQKTTVLEAEAATADTAGGEGAESDTDDEWDGDPVETCESFLRDAGLDPDDFSVWVDDEYGSLQLEADGYLDDDDFSAFRQFTDDLQMRYDPDGDLNYLPADLFGEVFG